MKRLNLYSIRLISPALIAASAIWGIALIPGISAVLAQTSPPFPLVEPEIIALPRYDAASATDLSALDRCRRMMKSGNYQGAADQLQQILTNGCYSSPEEKEFVDFLWAKISAITSNPAADERLNDFLSRWPSSVNANEARLLYADLLFKHRQWSAALEQYLCADISNLPRDDRFQPTLRLAVCRIRCGFYSEARELLDSMKEKGDKKTVRDYYEAYLDYVAGNNGDALEKFSRIAEQINSSASNHPDYSGEILYPDFYIAQLLFRLGEYDNCCRLSRNILKRRDFPEPLFELATLRVLGMSLFLTERYDEAEGPLDSYVEVAGPDATDDALYALGVCDYDNGRLKNAAANFSRLLDSHDVISQGAYLYLGKIEASEGNPSAAALNFEKAYRLNYDNRIAESALYNYIAACRRGGNLPFDSSKDMLMRFIDLYPESEYTPTVERSLASLCYRRGEFDEALKAIDHIRRPDKSDVRLKAAILYGAGASALSAGDAAKAVSLLQRCVELRSNDHEINAQGNLWLGDAYYRLKDWGKAEKSYRDALACKANGIDRALTEYNLAYSLLQQRKFSRASAIFLRLSESSSGLSAEMRRDARLRLGDCRYYSGNYKAAAADYDALRHGGANADYATYRYAITLGLNGDVKGKIAILERFRQDFSDSSWLGDAMTELGDTFAEHDDNPRAAEAYSLVIQRDPKGESAPKAMLGIAFADFSSGMIDEGLQMCKQLIKDFPASEEAAIADKELRGRYASLGNLAEYASFINGMEGYSLNVSEMDDLTFEAAQNRMLDGKEGVTAISGYIKEYPNGKHIAEAYSLYAVGLLDMGDRKKALQAYRELERRGGPGFATEAFTGIMRSTDNPAERLEYARKLRNGAGGSADILEEADFHIAVASLNSEAGSAERGNAEKILRKMSENPFSTIGARSAVTLGEYYLASANPQKALELMEKFTSSGSDAQYWVARGFIILSDAYKALGKDYLAKEYLHSLRDNYPGEEEDIRRMIRDREN